MISFGHKGDFDKSTSFFKRMLSDNKFGDLDKYGQQGVNALKSATPKDTGRTANSWYYTIEKKNGNVSINFNNSNINNGVPIAIILQYGHGTRNGGYVQGVDYINPTLKPIFNGIANAAWREVTKS